MVVEDTQLEPHFRLAKTILSTVSDPLRYQPLREAFQIRKQQPWLGRDDSRISALKRSKNETKLSNIIVLTIKFDKSHLKEKGVLTELVSRED